MRFHRTIWYITGAIVLIAAVILTTRKAGEESDPGQYVPRVEGHLAADMMALLKNDPLADQPQTIAAVESVASVAEQGAITSAETHYAIGLLRWKQQDLFAAERSLRETIALKPDWSWPHTALGILLANHMQNRAAEAETAFRTAIRLDPQWSRPYNDLAILLRISGRLDEAEPMAQAALRLDPNNVANRNNYGNLLMVRKRYDLAEPEYRKASDLDPAHPKPYYNLACLCSLRNRTEEAIALLAKAISLNAALREEAVKDPDFDPIRNDPRFQELVYGQP
jgi:Flp pilus assembly protein TadD